MFAFNLLPKTLDMQQIEFQTKKALSCIRVVVEFDKINPSLAQSLGAMSDVSDMGHVVESLELRNRQLRSDIQNPKPFLGRDRFFSVCSCL